MAGGGSDASARELDKTPTWAVSLVCAVIVVISILLEKVLHHIGQWFEKRHKKALFEALEKIKGELMVLGFISLLLTFGQNYISDFCIPEKYADTMLPCPLKKKKYAVAAKGHGEAKEHGHRRLLWDDRRFLAAAGAAKGCKHGFVPLISAHGLHQLHIFIFFLAVFHVIYSAITMMLGRLKVEIIAISAFFNTHEIRGWKYWERETVHEYEMKNDQTRFRLTHETSFVRDHTSFWTKTPLLFYIGCFYRQFFRAVRKADYLTMRHGFVTVHLAPGSKFDFQKYIKRSLEDDFKVVVGISPVLWTSAVIFLLLNVDGSHFIIWLSFMPLITTLAVGTKLQAIITQMAIEIQERHAVVQGIPLVQVSDRYFWFSWPKLVLYLIHLTLFQNAFEITYFFWIWYEFGLHSCFNENFTLQLLRVAMGVLVQFLCSYITLPLYALVTQMGSNMKRSIFDEQTSKALKSWHKNALKKKTESKSPHATTRTLGGSSGEIPHGLPAHGPGETANITASVDIPGEQQDDHNNRHNKSEPPDLLTGM